MKTNSKKLLKYAVDQCYQEMNVKPASSALEEAEEHLRVATDNVRCMRIGRSEECENNLLLADLEELAISAQISEIVVYALAKRLGIIESDKEE